MRNREMSRRKQARPIRHLDGEDDDGEQQQADGGQATGTSSSSLQLQDGDNISAPRSGKF